MISKILLTILLKIISANHHNNLCHKDYKTVSQKDYIDHELCSDPFFRSQITEKICDGKKECFKCSSKTISFKRDRTFEATFGNQRNMVTFLNKCQPRKIRDAQFLDEVCNHMVVGGNRCFSDAYETFKEMQICSRPHFRGYLEKNQSAFHCCREYLRKRDQEVSDGNEYSCVGVYSKKLPKIRLEVFTHRRHKRRVTVELNHKTHCCGRL